ncbi:Uncharacterised protein g1405 [Pycnogonum litorale]
MINIVVQSAPHQSSILRHKRSGYSDQMVAKLKTNLLLQRFGKLKAKRMLKILLHILTKRPDLAMRLKLFT